MMTSARCDGRQNDLSHRVFAGVDPLLGVFSIPWSMELRTMCMMGSPMLSTMVLSTSVSSPIRVKERACLFSFLHIPHNTVHLLESARHRHHPQRHGTHPANSSVSLLPGAIW